jgi:flagellar biosynthetic protein FlhB
MAEEDKQSKTEQPTGKRRQDAEKKSGPPRSRELSSSLTLMFSFLFLYLAGGSMFGNIRNCCIELLRDAASFNITQSTATTLMIKLMGVMAVILLPFFLAVVSTGLVASVSQTGFSFSSERITFNPGKLNPVAGFKKLFNMDSFAEVVKSVLKLSIVAYVAYRTYSSETEALILLTGSEIPEIQDFFGKIAFKLVLHTGGIMLVLGMLDYAFVRWRFIQNIKMTKQEVKDENKESEGDPKVKQKMKSVHMERARKRYRLIVPTADVVVTNPTHYAVALKYDRDRMSAPVVIAKGSDYLAQKIKEIARENTVTMVENRFLARELFSKVKEGEEIPEALYAAVAEVLAYVYGLKGRV